MHQLLKHRGREVFRGIDYSVAFHMPAASVVATGSFRTIDRESAPRIADPVHRERCPQPRAAGHTATLASAESSRLSTASAPAEPDRANSNGVSPWSNG